ncbi:MAG: hypothetical protein V7706_15195 [Dietzia psychralcaliphila]
MLLSLLGAIGFLGLAGSDDYNDYPGYTCSQRDGHVPSGFSPDRLPPMPDRVSAFHPNIDWSHERELFPAGVRCTYWLRDGPGITVVTHSPWSYTVCVYGFLLIAATQAVRVVKPERCKASA